jgi:hypothetical protein
VQNDSQHTTGLAGRLPANLKDALPASRDFRAELGKGEPGLAGGWDRRRT